MRIWPFRSRIRVHEHYWLYTRSTHWFPSRMLYVSRGAALSGADPYAPLKRLNYYTCRCGERKSEEEYRDA